MKADAKFNKRSAPRVLCDYADVTYWPSEPDLPIRLRFFGPQCEGDLTINMNALEAHRLVGQINTVLALHAKSLMDKATKGTS